MNLNTCGFFRPGLNHYNKNKASVEGERQDIEWADMRSNFYKSGISIYSIITQHRIAFSVFGVQLRIICCVMQAPTFFTQQGALDNQDRYGRDVA